MLSPLVLILLMPQHRLSIELNSQAANVINPTSVCSRRQNAMISILHQVTWKLQWKLG